VANSKRMEISSHRINRKKMKAAYRKGNIVKTKDGVMVITETIWLPDSNKLVYKVQHIQVLEELLMDENELFYRVDIEQLRNEKR
jgi:hypothetical protein